MRPYTGHVGVSVLSVRLLEAQLKIKGVFMLGDSKSEEQHCLFIYAYTYRQRKHERLCVFYAIKGCCGPCNCA